MKLLDSKFTSMTLNCLEFSTLFHRLICIPWAHMAEWETNSLQPQSIRYISAAAIGVNSSSNDTMEFCKKKESLTKCVQIIGQICHVRHKKTINSNNINIKFKNARRAAVMHFGKYSSKELSSPFRAHFC